MLQNKRIAEKGGSCKNHQPHISTADALAKPSPVVDEKKERQKLNNESISCTMLMINNNEAWRNKRGEKISNLLSLKNHLQIRFVLAFALWVWGRRRNQQDPRNCLRIGSPCGGQPRQTLTARATQESWLRQKPPSYRSIRLSCFIFFLPFQ